MKTRFPPRKIVAALDASQPSWAAFEAAKKLARRAGAALEGHYVEALLPAPQFEPALKTMQQAQRDKRGEVERGFAAALAEMPDLRASLRTTIGHPSSELLRRAHPRSCQLLVMGTHGRTGGERFLMGSTAESVFHRARVPVLAVRAGQAFEPANVLVPCNLESYADEALAYAWDLARAFGGRVTTLFVPTYPEWDVDADDGLRRRIRAVLGEQACSEVRRVIRQGEPREEIAQEVRQGDYGLLVLSGHHRDQLSDLALGTTAERLLRRCAVPLLVVPDSHPAPAARLQALGASLG